MLLAYGFSPNIQQISMSSQKRYHAQQLYDIISKQNNTHHWILIDNLRIPLIDRSQLRLACNMVSLYHNSICQDMQYIDFIPLQEKQSKNKN